MVTQALQQLQEAIARKRANANAIKDPKLQHLIDKERKEAKILDAKAMLLTDMVSGLTALMKTYDSLHSMHEYDLRVYTSTQGMRSAAIFNALFENAYRNAHYKDLTFFELLHCVSLAITEVLENEANGNVELQEVIKTDSDEWIKGKKALAFVEDLRTPENLPPPVKVGKPVFSGGYGLGDDSQRAIDSFKKANEHVAVSKLKRGSERPTTLLETPFKASKVTQAMETPSKPFERPTEEPVRHSSPTLRLPSDYLVREPKTVANPRYKPDLSFKTEDE